MKLEDIWRDTRSCIYQMILIGVLLLTPFPSFSFLGMGQRLYRNWHQCLKYINRCYCLYNDTSSRAQAFRSRSICSPTCTDPTSLWRWNPFGTYGCRMFCCWVACQHVPGSPRSRAQNSNECYSSTSNSKHSLLWRPQPLPLSSCCQRR